MRQIVPVMPANIAEREQTMKPIEIYYCIDAIMDEPCITLVEKSYWDENHYYDEYGESEHDEEIDDAMRECGTFCTITPHYNLDKGVTAESVIAKMREKGFTMLVNPEFTEYCDIHG